RYFVGRVKSRRTVRRVVGRSARAGLEHRDALDVVGVREEVVAGEGGDVVAVVDGGAQVARQRRRVAGDVDDPARPQLGERRDDLGPGAGARRVQDDGVDAAAQPLHD